MLKAFSIFLLFIAQQLLSGIITLIWANGENLLHGQYDHWSVNTAFSPTKLAGAMIISSCLLIFVLWSLRLTSQRPLSSILQSSPKNGWTLIAVFLIMGIGLSLFLQPFDLDDGGVMQIIQQGKGNWLMILMVCFVGPITEEVVFRDGIQRQLSSLGLRPWVAIGTTAASFGIVHMNLAQALPAIFLGILLGWLYHKTGDLRLCVPAHILNNSLAALALHYPEIDNFVVSCPDLLIYGIGGAVVISGSWLFYRLYS